MHTDTEDPAADQAAVDTAALPTSGLVVLHLFATVGPDTDRAGIIDTITAAQADDNQVITVAMLGHKADLGVMMLGGEPARLRQFQTALTGAGCAIGYSYLSLTELSEYAAGLPDAMKMARLRPHLPPPGMTAFCFYPMSKRREEHSNWYQLDYEKRLALMKEHGTSGRAFRGRILQLITGSTGLDDYEWGVTLFGRTLDDLKECVYQMRFDEASARFADFGAFLTGIVASPGEVLDMIGGSQQ